MTWVERMWWWHCEREDKDLTIFGEGWMWQEIKTISMAVNFEVTWRKKWMQNQEVQRIMHLFSIV